MRLAALALALADLACETVAMNARVMLDRRSLRLAWDDILQSLSKTPADVAIPYRYAIAASYTAATVSV